MGLDMFLYRRAIKQDEVAYWRKANAIHKWFSDKLADGNIENCREYYVSKDDLIELRDACRKVLNLSKVSSGKVKNGERLENNKWVPLYETGKVIDNPEFAQELLPTEKGPFFGPVDYDQYYIEDLKSTVKQIDKILEETDFDKDEIVYLAWW